MGKFFSLITGLAWALILTWGVSSLADSPCSSWTCGNSSWTRKTLTATETAQLPAEIRGSMQVAVEDLSQIWGDTILEGDYYAEEQIHVDEVTELYRGKELVGYDVTYSAKAWDTSDCEFDSEDLSTLATCQVGRISESSFISANFKQTERKVPGTFLIGGALN